MNIKAVKSPAMFENTSKIQALRPENPCKTSITHPTKHKIDAILRGVQSRKTNTQRISKQKKINA